MGSKGRTVVRMNMWGFTNPRMDVAKRLWSLHNAGCKVDVTLNRGRASRTIMRQLLEKSSRYGQMVVEDAWRDKNRNDYGEQYTHHKAMIINGYVQGKNQRVRLDRLAEPDQQRVALQRRHDPAGRRHGLLLRLQQELQLHPEEVEAAAQDPAADRAEEQAATTPER